MRYISFVIPCYRSENTIQSVINEIDATMKHHAEDSYEIVLVNDGSPDNTGNKIKELGKEHDKVTSVNLAKNFGQHSALMAGLRFAEGDYVVCLDDDGQTPADEVYKLIDELEKGYDVVYAAYPEKKHSGFRNMGSKLNAKMTEWLLGKPKDLYQSSFFIARRFVVDEIIKYTNPYPYMMGLVLRTTKNISSVYVNHRDRNEGASGYSIGKLIALCVNGFTAFSVKPLRIATYMGLGSAAAGFLYAIYAIIKKLTDPANPIGWTSTIIIILIIGGMILFVLGMIGEYIGRIYICINNSPQYVIRDITKKQKED